ncbi:hypothetical protein [Janibacter sp. DB-40]|uniref:hypothetical protein n=1 Tax=Janibacter sp. DB-40 TaxID=3028808 RepID=UPI0024069477|nr:hypothetical protein [Janibacter sp. DB-40]
MTRHDDPSWGPEDDELVRAALMSLMDDVSAQPLPEPEFIRARAEGRGTGDGSSVADLAVRRSRRRSFAFLAGAAAAAVVATTAGLYVANQSPDRPLATSTTQQGTTSSSSSAGSRLTMLGAGSWAAVLDRPVESTITAAPDGPSCFEPTDDASWSRGAPRLADGSVPAGQWIGMPRAGSEPLARAVETALDRCSDLRTTDRTRGTLAGGASYRAWLMQEADGARTWRVEVTDGDGLSFLRVPVRGEEGLAPEDIRQLALAVIGEADLTRENSTSETTATDTATATGTTTAPSPETTLIPPLPEDTGTGDDPSTAGTGTGTTGTPSSSAPSSTTPDGTIDSSRFLPADRWGSPALTGGAATTAGPLHLEGAPPYIESCITSELDAPVAATGIRSGPGEANYFGRQYIAVSSDADAVRSELLAGYSSGTCPGPAIGGSTTQLAPGIFRLQQVELTTYIAVVRMQGQGVSVLHLTEAKTAPQPLTDSVAVSELTRISDLAAAR